ncbi:amidohydrolase [Pseudomaricurvus alkylphenolicus]|jgi:2,3-dihydroxybenzoate decarboxylase|uniref:amidohydrolase family protein n=1 Tax=Pseudomaricurvus alkylphenolicus TaxID=1306991 RepID=UPI001420C33E|nr:amidohydrolase family protein [Pseudomaricurvus alkylphenolicus]NIB38897.1 amidohydrolase [Pseudomaricurvus alkylphenolicus]
MKGKIVFEEHMAILETTAETKDFAGESGRFDEFTEEILDLDDMRLAAMDRTGIELAILSLNAPAVQSILDTDQAIEIARKANDTIADAVKRHPSRYAGLAALPMQDPQAASEELKRCVKELGFKGALVNGFTQRGEEDSAIYYDIDEYRDFWATVSDLDVPFYLHPRMGLPSQSKNLEDHPWLRSSPWGFSVETATHALRLCGSGLFEDFNNLKIVIGHLGEFIPYNLWRMDARMRFSTRGYRGKKLLGDYFREHFYITTSGNFSDASFRCALETVGKDRICFCTDYPFERMDDAANWFDNTTLINDAERRQIGRENAIELFKLDME